jgi:peroxiredoxin
MARKDDIYQLPEGLPVPVDDGATRHLAGMLLPAVELASTAGDSVRLAAIPGRTVIYAYPRTGRPNQEPPAGWDEIAGARGCTPQSCSFRDHHAELLAGCERVFGLSTQTTEYQREAVERLHLPFALLSDHEHVLTDALRLPTFEIQDMRLIKRLSLVIDDGRITKVFYPVFPPHLHWQELVDWLRVEPAGSRG